MTDLEMDLMVAKARIKQLEQELAKVKPKRCSFGEGITIKPDGIHELDPCFYEVIEVHENVTVEVSRCKRCGHVELLWYKTEFGDPEEEGAE